MAEQVAVTGFNVPNVPGAIERGDNQPVPPASQQAPGFVQPPAPAAGTFTQAQVQEQIAAALAAAKSAPAAVVPPPAAQPQFAFADGDAGSDPVLSSMTALFTSAGTGIDLQRALGNALSRGDPSLIDLAYIQEKGGAQAAHLANVAKAIVERVQTQTTAAASAVYDTAGGKDQWTTAAAVFDQNAPAHLKGVIAGLLESGKPESIKYGAQTVLDYVKQNGLVVNPAQLIHAGAGNVGAAQALDKVGFQEALFKLDKNSRTYDQDRNALFARRQAGKQVGK